MGREERMAPNDRLLRRLADGRTDLVFDWLAAGGAADAATQGVPLIRWCAYYGDVSAIRLLIERGVARETLGDNLDLNGAAFHGHWRLAQFLLENGADPNAALADTGETPLHAALCKADRPAYGHVVRVLLAHGADPDARTKDGAPTGAFARDARTRGETPLHRAAAYAGPATIERLLDAGADREARDAHGDTPLAWASRHLRPGRVLDLLSYGEHRVHPLAVERWTSDHGRGWGNGLEWNLLGEPHAGEGGTR